MLNELALAASLVRAVTVGVAPLTLAADDPYAKP